MNGDRWSAEEDSRLRALRQSCRCAREISDRMAGRTYKAVISRLSIFGLSFPKPAGAQWTDERVSALTLMWKAGESASKIGEATGMTRNSVIGKAHRLGLDKRPSPIIRRNNVVEVEFRGCQWISNDPKHGPKYCGKTSVRYGPDYEGPRPPYCAHHLKAAYRPRENRKQRIVTAADRLFGKAVG